MDLVFEGDSFSIGHDFVYTSLYDREVPFATTRRIKLSKTDTSPIVRKFVLAEMGISPRFLEIESSGHS